MNVSLLYKIKQIMNNHSRHEITIDANKWHDKSNFELDKLDIFKTEKKKKKN